MWVCLWVLVYIYIYKCFPLPLSQTHNHIVIWQSSLIEELNSFPASRSEFSLNIIVDDFLCNRPSVEELLYLTPHHSSKSCFHNVVHALHLDGPRMIPIAPRKRVHWVRDAIQPKWLCIYVCDYVCEYLGWFLNKLTIEGNLGCSPACFCLRGVFMGSTLEVPVKSLPERGPGTWPWSIPTCMIMRFFCI